MLKQQGTAGWNEYEYFTIIGNETKNLHFKKKNPNFNQQRTPIGL